MWHPLIKSLKNLNKTIILWQLHCLIHLCTLLLHFFRFYHSPLCSRNTNKYVLYVQGHFFHLFQFMILVFSVVWQMFDSPEEIKAKVEKLAQLIKESQYLVVHSGAGISTSAGIPDFRWGKFTVSHVPQSHWNTRDFITLMEMCVHNVTLVS